MSEALVVGIVRQAIETAIIVSLPMLLAGLIAGVLVSIFQTVTSIQDNVLAFIPRAAAIFVVVRVDVSRGCCAWSPASRAESDPAAARARPVIDLDAGRRGSALLLVRPGMLVMVAPGVRRRATRRRRCKIGLTVLLALGAGAVGRGAARDRPAALAGARHRARGGDRPVARARRCAR